MKLPKSVPGVTRGMSALSGYIGQAGVEPSCRVDLSLGWDCSVLCRTVPAWRN